MLKIKYHKSEINFIVGFLGLNYIIYYKIQYKTYAATSKIPHDLNGESPQKKIPNGTLKIPKIWKIPHF